eukprot:732065-Prymnesium_polylepis.1
MKATGARSTRERMPRPYLRANGRGGLLTRRRDGVVVVECTIIEEACNGGEEGGHPPAHHAIRPPFPKWLDPGPRPFRRRQCSARTPKRPDGATIRSTDSDTRHDDHSTAHGNNKHSKHTFYGVTSIPMLALHTRARLSARPLRALAARASGGAHADAAIVFVDASS